jgi:hypothetical protein
MIKNFLLLWIVSFLCLFSTSNAHDFDVETVSYMLSNTGATWTDFESYMLSIDNWEFESFIEDSDSSITTALTLPWKRYLVNYALENPDFTYTDIKREIWNDPMLSELWTEVLYSFLSERLQDKPWYTISWDYFQQIVTLWLTHILSWMDHILFILTLIICLPKTKRILLLISTFTIAHSITIFLWWASIVAIPSIVVESMILVSIIIMAIYATTQKIGTVKNIYAETALIFLLWLFHGLWFAWFFREILDTSTHIFFPIFAFNIWVEIWQVLVLIISLSLLYYIYKYFPKYKEHIKNVIAIFCIIFSLGMLVGMFM